MAQSVALYHYVEAGAGGKTVQLGDDYVVVGMQVTENSTTNPFIAPETLSAQLNKSSQVKFKGIAKYPATRRDLALLIDKGISFSQIEKIASKVDKKILKAIDLFDVFEGDQLPEGKKSYAVSFVFQDENKTLTDKEVDKVMN